MTEDPYAAEAEHRLAAREVAAERGYLRPATFTEAGLGHLARPWASAPSLLHDPAEDAVASTPRDELRAFLDGAERSNAGRTYPGTRYIRGELAVPPPDQDVCVAVKRDHPYPLHAQDAARALGIEGMVGVHVGWRWADHATQWEVCELDRDGARVGPWVAVPPRTTR